MTMTDFVFAVPGEGHIIDTVAEDGRSAINRQTLDEIRERYPNAEQIAWADWQAEKVRKQDTPITWTKVTERKYHEMLEVLPPIAWTANGFLVGEPDDHHAGNGRPRFRAYIIRQYQHFVSSRPLTVAEFKALTTVETRKVCPNCEQWQHASNGDCMNECVRRGFAPKRTV